ncbi:MAG: SRPBCC domain-containing protein [Saprospiraceae bacterium]|nr:SRPBCC domain-containing protein [Saprospiraceae bacterium]
MAKKEIKTAIDIAASPEAIWSVLTHFSEYKNWNPFIKLVEGDFRVGNRVKINAGGMVFRPEVLVFNPNKEIVWLGKLLFTGLFDGEHRFTIIDNGNGECTFKHEERFNGLLVGLFSKNWIQKPNPDLKP